MVNFKCCVLVLLWILLSIFTFIREKPPRSVKRRRRVGSLWKWNIWRNKEFNAFFYTFFISEMEPQTLWHNIIHRFFIRILRYINWQRSIVFRYRFVKIHQMDIKRSHQLWPCTDSLVVIAAGVRCLCFFFAICSKLCMSYIRNLVKSFKIFR